MTATATELAPPMPQVIGLPRDVQAPRMPSSPVASAESSQAQQSAGDERMPPWPAYLLIQYINMLLVINIVIVVPTAEQYAEKLGADTLFSGLVVSLTPFAAALGVILNRWMLSFSDMKTVLMIMVTGSVVGNLIYAIAGLTKSKYSLLVARFLIGLCSAQMFPHCYIGKVVGIRHRSRAMFHFQVSSMSGYVLGPLIAWGLEVFLKELRIENLLLDSDTAPGWLMAGLYFALMLKLFLIFESPSAEPPSAEASRLVSVALQAAALFLAALMACNIPICFLAGKMTKTWEDCQGLLVACGLGILVTPLLFCFGLRSMPWRIVVPSFGLMLTPGVNMLLRGFSMSSITKLVPPELKDTASAIVMCSACLSRGTGALLGSVLDPNSLGGVQLGLLLVSGACTSAAYAHFRPHDKAQ
eukprot:CAMPEP_0115338600 /NCGR_PEP_ID=MMETSP0270-20121206/90162_1 /TAXON_ID=71861 /ORGANISM="Scrippsiella trochoidea, Strain CCMP3099" /LENGTH=413 /DNA_ID=CAMNT_0002759923 /DNA_START=76 /DNA_END=1317 /DNA_ORIENTATION=+